ncbi:hydroxymethylglutaryl-CoA lyase [Desulfatirhabdium butyrativorans]|uniref:hydroxymethylglutaryl-CoA lyase n=1 Tax=Desulfatirhabdium butyrativorans TaxID=340467 RepID=UPI000415242B|nr:hydroxymethylglutaryl-CoA lyase [Desulfatirhabdium butyrativorans]
MKPGIRIQIREVAPRDGFQSWPEFIPTAKKLEIVRMLIEAGITEMETTSFVHPKAIPQMRDAAAVMAGVPRNGCVHCPLVPNRKGAELALNSGADKLVVVISATDAHNLANVRRTVAASLHDLQSIFDLARECGKPVMGAIAVAFGCPYQGDVPEDDVYRLADAYVCAGASSLILADTTGMATPTRIVHLLSGFANRFSQIPYSLHLHNNRGTAMANLYAALDLGASTFDTALGGIGGCPNVPHAAGNLATEDVVFMLEDMGYSTGIDLMKLILAARYLESILGKTLPGQVMKSGPRDPKQVEALNALVPLPFCT